MLFPKTDIAPPHLPPAKAQAKGIVAAVSKMHYSAAGVAPLDLAAGLDFLQELRQQTSFSWLSVNLVNAATGKTPFLPYILHQIGGTTIGIIGLTGPLGKNHPPEAARDIKILPWVETLPKIIEGVRDQADMVILLSSYPENVNRVIAERFPDIHLIIEAGGKAANKPPTPINNTLLCRTGERGKYLGMLRINWRKSGKWGEDVRGRLKELKNNLDRIQWLLGRLEKEKAGEDLSKNKRHRTLLREKEEMEGEIQRLQSTIDHENTRGPSSYDNEFIALETSMPDDPEIRAIVLNTRRTVNELNRRALKEESAKLHNRQPEKDRLPGRPGLSSLGGWKSCAKCHPAQTAFWRQTPHARAYQTLEEEDQQFKPDCLWCHVTLPSYESGSFTDNTLRMIRMKPELQSVGCETCHGPGKKHNKNPREVPLSMPHKRLCLSCHTGEHDDNFQFKTDIKKVGCPVNHAKDG